MSEVIFLDFNQENNCMAVGTRSGYKIYNCDPFGKCYEKEEGGMNVVSMLFCTSLVALVGGGEHPALSPRRLQIVNTKRETTIIQMSFATKILAAKLNRKRLMVILEDKVHIYDITNMKEIHTIDTPMNSKGIGALSPSSENCYLACPSQQNTGDVMVFDASNLVPHNIIQAHKTPLACIAFNEAGTLLATASDKGTIIRIFSLPDCQCRYQFRRGSFSAAITHLSFNMPSTFLTVCSDSETIHLFRLKRASTNESSGTEAMFDASSTTNASSADHSSPVASAGAALANLVPTAIAEILEPERDFAHIKIPDGKICRHIAALNTNLPQVMVATFSGFFYLFALDIERGGECTLIKQYSLLSDSD